MLDINLDPLCKCVLMQIGLNMKTMDCKLINFLLSVGKTYAIHVHGIGAPELGPVHVAIWPANFNMAASPGCSGLHHIMALWLNKAVLVEWEFIR